MVVSFADAADHRATTLDSAAHRKAMDMESNLWSLHQKVLCKILGTETHGTMEMREGCTILPRLLLPRLHAFLS